MMGTLQLNCLSYMLVILLILNLFNYGVLSTAFNESEVDAVIKKTFACHNNPGLAVSVVKDGKVIFSKGYGVTDIDTKEPVTNQTRFQIASISKSFAATLLVKLLYEKTKLNVDSKVKKLLGDKFKMPDTFRTQATTFADLMGHKIGINGNNRIRLNRNLTRDNLMDFISQLPAPHQFRVKYFYSNLMYGLITYLAEVIGGKSWEDLVQEHLYSPIGMNDSTFATTGNFSDENFAQGYQEEKTGEFTPVPHEFSRRWALLAGSGAVVSTADDMAKYMHFHLHGGQSLDGVEVMKETHLREVHKPRFLISSTSSKDTQIPRFPVTSQENLYAHGFRVGHYRGYERLSHTGSTFGYRAQVSLLPDEKIGVFTALTGKDDSYKYRVPLHFYLMDAALGLSPWLNSSTICSYPAPWKSLKKKRGAPKLDASIKLKRAVREYEGTYYNKAYGNIHVKYNKTLNSLVLTYGWGTWRLFPQPKLSGDKFYGDGMDLTHIWDISPFQFIGYKKNPKNIFKLKAIGFESTLPPYFKKLIPGKSTRSKALVKKKISQTSSIKATKLQNLKKVATPCIERKVKKTTLKTHTNMSDAATKTTIITTTKTPTTPSPTATTSKPSPTISTTPLTTKTSTASTSIKVTPTKTSRTISSAFAKPKVGSEDVKEAEGVVTVFQEADGPINIE